MCNDVVLVTGGFDPLHSGHIAFFNEAKSLGDFLVVGINSDNWLTRKKGKPFLSFKERETIISNLRMVDLVIAFNDDDGTAQDAITKTRKLFSHNTIIFANGGDRTITNIPEMSLDDSNLKFQFEVGGSNKRNSSSWILKKWKEAQ